MEQKFNEFIKWIIRPICLVIFFCFALMVRVEAQTYYFDKYGVNEGLGSSKVYTIIQDSQDYLWLGTASGVSRFGGREIENFSADDGLSTGGVYSLFEDQFGGIWFGHLDGGLSFYDGKNFQKVIIDTISLKSDITSISEIGGRMWFTTRLEGAFSAEFNVESVRMERILKFKGAEGLSDQVFGSYVDKEGDYYCITEVGIKRYLPTLNRFETYRPEGLSTFFLIITMFDDSSGNRWFGTYNGGLQRMDGETGKIKIFDIKDGLAKNWITYITEDSKGRIWIGTWGGGITVFDGDDIRNYDNTNGLDAMEIQCLLEDKEGNMIIASQFSGLHIFKGDHFVNFISDRLFNDKIVMAVEEDKFGRMWFGTNDGITLYDSDSKLSWIFNQENSDISNGIRFIKSDQDDNIWIGTALYGMFRYDFKENKFIEAEEVNNILYKDNSVTALAVDHQNNLWIGTNDGVGFWNIETGEGDRYTQIDGLAGLGVMSILVDNAGKVWIGTERDQGLTCYDPSTETFEIIEFGFGLSPTSLGQTEDGTIWVGTTFGIIGLIGDSLIHLTQKDGLISNNINLLQPDNNGFLYIGTNLGLNRYNLETGAINTYTKKNGFIGIETNRNSSLLDKQGKLWFGTSFGVSSLNPEEIPAPDLNPLTHIQGILINLEPREIRDGLRFSYKENSIVIDYYSVCLTNPEAVRYKVMLSGAELDWRPETDQTRAIYSALSPGKYTFMVKAVNSDGIWNDDPVTFSFSIRPPFYFSPIFILFMVIVIITAIISYIKIRERNLVVEKRILEEKVEIRTAEVVQKSQEIEEKNRDITASIRYAERIQMAMLPPEDSFDETFVLFKPKDIVSGDFYWMHDNGDYQFIAAVDCTGHGVPGAFMSIIGYNSLTKIVREYGITRPAAILDQLNIEVTRSLLQRGEQVINDGMDLSLISLNRRDMKLEFSGAYNPLIVIREGVAETIKADRFPIGMAYAKDRKFTNVEVDVKSGDMLYMFSDGYSDQFGGPNCKKFKVGTLKNVFLEIYKLPMVEQRERLEEVLSDWMGCQSQVDDILIIGTKIP